MYCNVQHSPLSSMIINVRSCPMVFDILSDQVFGIIFNSETKMHLPHEKTCHVFVSKHWEMRLHSYVYYGSLPSHIYFKLRICRKFELKGKQYCKYKVLVIFLQKQKCHHRNLSTIYIVQNIFHQGKVMRNISLNAHYIVLFKSQDSTDKQQISMLAR